MKPLSLTIAGQNITFESPAAFEFCLAGRTDVPARKIALLMSLGAEELKQEARTLKAVERQFAELLRKSVESPGSIATHLREIDLEVFAQDHDWRDIVLAMQEKGPEYDELRRVSLVKYMQYLTSRQEIIRHTYALKRAQAAEGLEAQRLGEQPGRGAESPADARARGIGDPYETIILPAAKVRSLEAADRQEGFSQLPKGEAVTVDLSEREGLELLLARHRFRLFGGSALRLVDEHGTSHTLQAGKNIVGRDPVCNVVVDGVHRDVSRLHLIIEALGPKKVQLTDLSSHGTQMAVEKVADAPRTS